MSSNITPNNLRGFLIPSSTVTHENIWESQSSFTQQNGRSGVPEAQQVGTSMILSTVGDQTNPVTVMTQNGGTPGVSANYTWKYDSSIFEYGRSWKGTATDWNFYIHSGGAGRPFYTHTDATQLINGTLFTVHEYDKTSGERSIQVFKKVRDDAVTLVNTLFTQTFSTA